MNFNFREFLLKELAGMNREEIIQTASRERREATDFNVGRGGMHAYKRQRQEEYISDLGGFLNFVRYSENSGMPWPEAYLASPGWKNTQRARNLDVE